MDGNEREHETEGWEDEFMEELCMGLTIRKEDKEDERVDIVLAGNKVRGGAGILGCKASV